MHQHIYTCMYSIYVCIYVYVLCAGLSNMDIHLEDDSAPAHVGEGVIQVTSIYSICIYIIDLCCVRSAVVVLCSQAGAFFVESIQHGKQGGIHSARIHTYYTAYIYTYE